MLDNARKELKESLETEISKNNSFDFDLNLTSDANWMQALIGSDVFFKVCNRTDERVNVLKHDPCDYENCGF